MPINANLDKILDKRRRTRARTSVSWWPRQYSFSSQQTQTTSTTFNIKPSIHIFLPLVDLAESTK